MLIDRAVVRAALPGYTVDRELGRGAFGLVIAGRDRLGRDVAIKAMPAWSDSREPAEAGLTGEAEARLLAGLDHPHVVRVFDFVERDGLALIVMELVSGGSLRGAGAGAGAGARAGTGTLSAPAVCGLGLAVADALHHAHERGVLHRDVKPTNLLMAADGTVKVADFGIAKAFEGSAVAASKTAGTPRYMAPEQFTLGPLRPSTDLYALGVVLYELLAGRHPFHPAPSTYEGFRQAHLEAPPAGLPDDVPGPVATVIERMLAKDPGSRFPDGRSCALALTDAAVRAFGSDWLASCGYPVQVSIDVVNATTGDDTGQDLGHDAGPDPGHDSGPAAESDGPGRAEETRQVTVEEPTPTPTPASPSAAGGRLGRRRSRRPRFVVAAALAVATAVATGVAVPLTVTADRQSAASTAHPSAPDLPPSADDIARRSAAAADSVRDRQPDLARRLALAAYRVSPVPEAVASLLASAPLAPIGPALTGHTAGVNAVAFSPTGRLLASASVDHTVRLWTIDDALRAAPVGEPLRGHVAGLAALAFSPDGAVLASAGDDGTVHLWDVRDPARVVDAGPPLTGHPSPELYTSAVRALAFSPDGHLLAAGGKDRTVRIWDVRDPARPVPVGQPLTGHGDAVVGVAFSPDGAVLASASADGTARLWDTHDLGHIEPVGPPLDHQGQLTATSFGLGGQVLASAAGTQTRLWDVHAPAHPRPFGQPLAGPTALISAVAFDPARPLLVVASYDTTVWLWDVRDPHAPVRLGRLTGGHTGPVRATSFSPAGGILATASTDKTVRLWDLDPDHVFRRLCGVPADALSPREWRTYLPEIAYRPVCD